MGAAAADYSDDDSGAPVIEHRAAPRFTSLIRSAKLVTGQGEFVCVVRDVSSSGVRLRCFHDVPRDPYMALALQNGELLEIERVRGDGNEASFRFAQEIPVERLVRETGLYPRRLLRLNIAMPLTLRTLGGPVAAVTENISQQGCRAESVLPLALAQAVIVESSHFPGVRAKVRWRRDGVCGLVFDDTFTLRDFAVHTARLQCPALAAA